MAKKKGVLKIFADASSHFSQCYVLGITDNDYFRIEDNGSYDIDSYEDCNPREGKQFSTILNNAQIRFVLEDEDGNDITMQALNADRDQIDTVSLCCNGNEFPDRYEYLEDDEPDLVNTLKTSLNCTFASDDSTSAIAKVWKKLQNNEISGSRFYHELIKQAAGDEEYMAIGVDSYQDSEEIKIVAQYSIEWDGEFDFNKICFIDNDEYFNNISALEEAQFGAESALLDAIIYDGVMFSGYAELIEEDDEDYYDMLSNARNETYGIASKEQIDEDESED